MPAKHRYVPTHRTLRRVPVRRDRWRRLISAAAVAAVVLGGVTGAGAAGAQPEGRESRATAAFGTGVVDPAVEPYLDPTMLQAVPVGPGDVSPPVQTVLNSPAVTTALDGSGIPEVALQAYQRAAAILAINEPACHLPWQLIAAIGRVESDHGRFGGAMLLSDGYGTRPIRGIPLDGRPGVALIRDTDGGELDGDPKFDRAVGPMQFIPSTWAAYGVDANGDGKKDPNNIFDAALTTADYLCAAGGDMTSPTQEAAAVRRYNNADEYVRVVLALAESYEHGDAAAVPTGASGGTVDNGGGTTAHTPSSSTPRTPSSAHAAAPTPNRTPTATATPHPTAPSSPTTTPNPTPDPPATPTEAPRAQPTTTAPATPAPTDTTETTPKPPDQPTRSPAPPATQPSHPDQTANTGWAPAMRQVVVKLLTAPNAAPSKPVPPTHPGSRPAETTTPPGPQDDGTHHK
jgi:membrane-bound lytic murein transglycosylase B